MCVQFYIIEIFLLQLHMNKFILAELGEYTQRLKVQSLLAKVIKRVFDKVSQRRLWISKMGQTF